MSYHRNDRLFSLRSELGNVTSLILFLGVALILLGALLQTGVWAGMFGIVGALFVTVAVVGRLLLWLSRRM
jgi:hypothetical protein